LLCMPLLVAREILAARSAIVAQGTPSALCLPLPLSRLPRHCGVRYRRPSGSPCSESQSSSSWACYLPARLMTRVSLPKSAGAALEEGAGGRMRQAGMASRWRRIPRKRSPAAASGRNRGGEAGAQGRRGGISPLVPASHRSVCVRMPGPLAAFSRAAHSPDDGFV
jgi:hypothetical protein